MKKYSSEDIRKIISDVRFNASLLDKELICDLIECKKYVIPEKREEWCDLIRAIFYDIESVIPSIMGSNEILVLRCDEKHDNKILNEILEYIHVAEIMESYAENHNINDAINTLENMNLKEQYRISVIHEVLRFSMFGTEFVSLVAPERIKRTNFKHEYDEIHNYLSERRDLESRLAFAIKVKTTLEEYKKHCLDYYFWECDNTEDKKIYRKERLEKIGDDYLLTIVNNTMIFAKYVLQKMKDENKDYEDKTFTSVHVLENDYLSLGSTGGHFADQLYQVECYGNTIWISGHVLKSILEGLSLENDYDVEERIDGDIGCMYTYPKLNLSLELNKFNEYYEEFFENRKRSINL